MTPGFASIVDGNSLVQAPEHTFTFNATYAWETEMGEWSLGATYIYKDEEFYTIFNDPDTTVPSSARIDFRGTWTDPDGSLRLNAYVRNAFDEEIYLGFNRADELHGNQVHGEILPDRRFGVERVAYF